MRPRFTDDHKFSGGAYVPASKTDIGKTFARIRREMAEQERRDRENMKNVKSIKKVAK